MFHNALTARSEKRSKGTPLLIVFLIFLFFSQAVVDKNPILSVLALGCAALVLVIVLLVGNRNTLFLLLFTTTAMGILIPHANQRELKLVIPSLVLVTSVIRFSPKFLHIKVQYLHPIVVTLGIFFCFCVIGVFNNIKIPGVNAEVGSNSGLLNRFNLLNSVLTFMSGLILFNTAFIEGFIRFFFRFYLIVLLVSIAVVIFELGSFPFFNTFSWTLLVENEQSKKLIIAGVASSFVLTYTLVFIQPRQVAFFPLVGLSFLGVILSGSRTAFVVALLTFLIVFVTKRRILGKSIVLFAAAAVVAVYALLSPMVLLVPEKYQRLVVIFPPELYSGKVSQLSETAAASSTRFRLKIWSMAKGRISESPIFGNSFGTPQADYSFQGDPLAGFQAIPEKVLWHDFMVTGSLHNTFISIAYLLGIPAVLLFLYFFLRLIWLQYHQSLRLYGREQDVVIFMVVLLIHYFLFAMVGDIIFDLQFMILLAMEVKMLLFYIAGQTGTPSISLK